MNMYGLVGGSRFTSSRRSVSMSRFGGVSFVNGLDRMGDESLTHESSSWHY